MVAEEICAKDGARVHSDYIDFIVNVGSGFSTRHT